MLTPVIICGGSGTRLWPLSRNTIPKQFFPLIGSKSLLEETMHRSKRLSGNKEICVIANQEHRFFVQEAANLSNTKCKIFLEPVARNTTAAMAVAALNARDNEILLFMPSDHFIPNTEYLFSTIESGVREAKSGSIVVFGVRPNSPHLGYGYIQIENSKNKLSRVKSFVEKPNFEQATQYLSSSNYFWNSGMFLCTAKTLIDSLEEFAPDILDAVKNSVKEQKQTGEFIYLNRESLLNCRAQSIDYSVMEHHKNILMAEFNEVWSDIGNWSELYKLLPKDAEGNVIIGQGHAYQSVSTFIHGMHRPVVTVGTNNLIVVDDRDALLIVEKDHAEKVKEIVPMLKSKNIKQAEEHCYSIRPWGSFDVLDQGENYKVKRLRVNPGGRLSLQMHHHRAEHWVVVKGAALVTKENEKFNLHENESTYIPNKTKHRLENQHNEILEIIETQTGTYLGEDDIVRFEDFYGR